MLFSKSEKVLAGCPIWPSAFCAVSPNSVGKCHFLRQKLVRQRQFASSDCAARRRHGDLLALGSSCTQRARWSAQPLATKEPYGCGVPLAGAIYIQNPCEAHINYSLFPFRYSLFIISNSAVPAPAGACPRPTILNPCGAHHRHSPLVLSP